MRGWDAGAAFARSSPRERDILIDDAELRRRLGALEDPKGGGGLVATGRVSGLTTRGGAAGLVLDIGGLSPPELAALRARIGGAVPGARIIETAERKPPEGRSRSGPARTPHDRPPPDLRHIRRIVAIASGKGGVGKSTIAANLAVALAAGGERVGLLDADIYGPSVPTLLGIDARAEAKDKRIQPLRAHGLKALSIGNLVEPDKAVIWRGPMAGSALVQMLGDTDWGELDTLIVDLPPGTGDVQLSLVQKVPLAGAVIVSTPQDLALIDARRAMAMFDKVNVPVLGIVENMSTFHCPECGAESHIFGHGGAEETSRAAGVPFLGAVPLTLLLRETSDAGRPAVLDAGPAAEALKAVAAALRRELERTN